MVQGLRLCAPNAGGQGSGLVLETRSHTLQLRALMLQVKIPLAATGRKKKRSFTQQRRLKILGAATKPSMYTQDGKDDPILMFLMKKSRTFLAELGENTKKKDLLGSQIKPTVFPGHSH